MLQIKIRGVNFLGVHCCITTLSHTFDLDVPPAKKHKSVKLAFEISIIGNSIMGIAVVAVDDVDVGGGG